MTDPGEFSLVDLLRPFGRYYWVVLVTVAACVISTLAFSFSKPVTYVSSSLIIIDRADPKLVVDLIEARNGRAVQVEQLTGGLLAISFTAESPDVALSRLGAIIEQSRLDIAGLLPDYETRMAIAREEYDRLVALANTSESPAGSVYLTGPAAELTRIIFDLRAAEPNETSLLKIIEEPTVPVRSEPRLLSVHIVVAVVLGLALGGFGVFVADARDKILQRRQSLAANGMEAGQPAQEPYPGDYAGIDASKANGISNGGSASRRP